MCDSGLSCQPRYVVLPPMSPSAQQRENDIFGIQLKKPIFYSCIYKLIRISSTAADKPRPRPLSFTPPPQMAPKVFLITGTSAGFGREYAQYCLDKGDYVVATARNPNQLSLKNTTDANYLPLRLDVTDK